MEPYKRNNLWQEIGRTAGSLEIFVCVENLDFCVLILPNIWTGFCLGPQWVAPYMVPLPSDENNTNTGATPYIVEGILWEPQQE